MHKKWNLTHFSLMSLHLCTALVFVLFSGSIARAAITAASLANAGSTTDAISYVLSATTSWTFYCAMTS